MPSTRIERIGGLPANCGLAHCVFNTVGAAQAPSRVTPRINTARRVTEREDVVMSGPEGGSNRSLPEGGRLARLAGIEPTTLGFGGQYSIH